MATSLTLNEDLVCANLTITAGTSFYGNGYDVTTEDVSIDSPVDIGLGGGSVWNVSGNWLETTVGCSGTWGYSGSHLILSGIGKTITKIYTTASGSQFFSALTIATGATITDGVGSTAIINAFGDLSIYGSYTSTTAELGLYYGGKMYLYDAAILHFQVAFNLYDYFGGGGIAHYHPDASISGGLLTNTFPKTGESVLAPGDYSNITQFRLSGGSAIDAILDFQTGTYIFNQVALLSSGAAFSIGFNLAGTSGVIVKVNDYLVGGSAIYNMPSYFIDNSSSDAQWFIGGNVTLSSTYSLTWIKGTGMNVLFGSLDQTLDFADADVGWFHCVKTAGQVIFEGIDVEISGNYPGNVAMNDAASYVSMLDGETMNFEGTFTVNNGDLRLGDATTLNMYDDFDWSGVTAMGRETSTLVCKADATWTWKDNTGNAPFNVTVDAGATLTAVAASSNYANIYGVLDIYGTFVTDVSIQYLSLLTDAELRVHPYGEITLHASVFTGDILMNYITTGNGITLFSSEATFNASRILWYRCEEASVIVPGDYNLSLYVYGANAYLNLDPDGDYYFGYLYLDVSVGSNTYFTAPRNIALFRYLQLGSGIAGTFHIDTTAMEKMQITQDAKIGHASQLATINWTAGSGEIELISPFSFNFWSPVTVNNDPIDRITLNLPVTTYFMVISYKDLYCKGMHIQSGELDFGSKDLHCVGGDFIVSEDGNFNSGGVINADSISYRGTSESSKKTISHTIESNATFSCQAYYVDLSNNNASGVAGVAFGSTDSGSNTNWSFETATNEIVAPANGLNFIMRTLRDVEIVTSNYALGFYGAGGRLATIEPGASEWSTNTFLTDIGGTKGEVQCRNVQYASDSTAYVDHLLTPVALTSIPNYLGTLNIRLLDDDEIFVAIAEAKFYDGHDTTNPPNGIDIKISELRHPNYRLNYLLGRGDDEWRDVGDGSTFSLSQSPGEHGVKSNSMGYWAYDQHDWYLAITVSPQTIGDREFGLQVSVEYL